MSELAHYITQVGGLGVGHLAVDPNKRGENHAKLIRAKLDLPGFILNSLGFVAKVPIWDEQVQKRVRVDFPIRLPEDCIAVDLQLEPDTYDISKIDPDEWNVESFVGHPNARKYGIMRAKPTGFYTDKISYAKKDSFFDIQSA